MPKIDALFRLAREKNASDLHLLQGLPPKVRIHGDLEPIADHPALTTEMMHEYLYEIARPDQIARYEATGDLDFAYALDGVARFRCNYLRQVHGLGAVFRQVPDRIMTCDDLRLPPAIARLAHLRSGLVLVAGPAGSGKSTTLAAIVDAVNRTYKKHIITIEGPIEFVHENHDSVISQREVGTHTDGFAEALEAAIHEDPDVVLVGELRDAQSIHLALRAAERGVLVFAALPTGSAVKSIDHVLDAFPADRQPLIRAMLAESLAAVVSQHLLKRKDGKGRMAALEVLVRTDAVANLIREGDTAKLIPLMAAGGSAGMQFMDDALMKLLKEDVIDGNAAYMKAFNKSLFEPYRTAE